MERARRVQLIACAIDSLAQGGFSATSIASVAARADISKSVVLYYFASKAGLLEAVVDTVYADAAAGMPTPEPGGTGRQDVIDHVRACVEFADRNRTRTAALTEIFANLRTDNGALRYGAAENAPMINFVADLIRRGQRDGSIREVDATLTATTIRSQIDALPGLFAAQPDLVGVADHLADLVDHALRPPHRSTS